PLIPKGDPEFPLSPSSSHSSNNSLAQALQIWNQVTKFLAELPDQVGKFFDNYQQPLIVVGLLLVALISLKVVLAALSAINSIPVVKPTFELVGFGYTTWFIYRYLLLVKNRKELAAVTRSLQEQIVGKAETQRLLDLGTRNWKLETGEKGQGDSLTNLTASSLINPELEQQFTLLIGTIRTIRNLRAEADVKPGMKVPIILQSQSGAERQILEAGQSYIQDLGKVETLTIAPALEKQLQTTMAGVIGTVQVLMPLAGIVDVDALQAKLEKNLAKVEAEIKSLSGRLANQNFVSKAPPEVVQGAKEALEEAQKQAEILRDRLDQLTKKP
ncbi:MAG: valine--tRNA ligase, partial [Coleofasciculus sp. Co-bin14]|nr:valine--tRNA ligase [Coleofasciculus sp. Co-bin14]